jgi:regulator of protease activity HflC (stomatin/prohibitin superfamily)
MRFRPLWRRFKHWYWARRRVLLLEFLVLFFAFVMLAPFILITIPAGHLGVHWKRFFGGTVIGQALDEGLHVIFPWDLIYRYDARLQARSETYDTISKDGLSLQVSVTFRWRPVDRNLGALHRDIGPNYVEALLVPEIGSVTREVIARHDWQDLASEQRQVVQQQILEATTTPGRPFVTLLVTSRARTAAADASGLNAFDYIGVKDILITTVLLPLALRLAVERKLDQSQIAEEYKFRLTREKLESERKAIEATGIRAFQQTVQAGISETYLKWRGIEATLELARSPNAKIVVIGGNNGLPIILNTGDELKGNPAGSQLLTPKSDQSPIVQPPNRPTDAAPGPNVPLPPLPSTPAPELAPLPGPPAPASSPPTPAPPAPSLGGATGIIEQLGATLSRTLGWDNPPAR